jgi:hypothetical protein
MKQKSRIADLFLLILSGIVAVFIAVGCSTSETGTPEEPPPPEFFFATLHSVEDNPIALQLVAQGVSIESDTSGEKHGLIVDGDKMSPEELRSNQTVWDYLKNDKALLVLNATGEHKQALVKLIGIAFGNDTSLGYCVIPDPSNSGRRMTIIDHPRAIEWDPSDFSVSNQEGEQIGFEMDDDAFMTDQEYFKSDIENVSGPYRFVERIVERLRENRTILVEEGDNNDIPPELKNYQWRYIPEYDWKLNNAWWRMYKGQAKLYFPSPQYPEGYQAGNISPTVFVALYLDNSPNNANGDFQYLVVDHQGAADPISGPNSTDSGNNVVMPIDDKSYYSLYTDQGYDPVKLTGFGYAQMQYLFSFMPEFTDYSNFHFYSASPANKVEDTTYTSGYDLDVGFNKEGVEGRAGISHETETDVSDWEVDNLSNTGMMNFYWNWYSMDPKFTEHINHLNNNNCKLFQPQSSGVLMTKQVSSATYKFQMQYGVNQISEDARYGIIHHYVGRFDAKKNFAQKQDVTVDFSSVLYPIMELIAVSPTQVKGGSPSTGTVTIDTPAPAGGVTVNLESSNTTWATVPDTVVIPEGQESQDFTITTYAVTGNPTVTIRATLNKVTVNVNLIVKG